MNEPSLCLVSSWFELCQRPKKRASARFDPSTSPPFRGRHRPGAGHRSQESQGQAGQHTGPAPHAIGERRDDEAPNRLPGASYTLCASTLWHRTTQQNGGPWLERERERERERLVRQTRKDGDAQQKRTQRDVQRNNTRAYQESQHSIYTRPSCMRRFTCTVPLISDWSPPKSSSICGRLGT